MNVGHVCKAIPAYLPHELLGYKKDSLKGMLLTMEIVEKINEEEEKQTNDKTGQSQRLRKFRSRK